MKGKYQMRTHLFRVLLCGCLVGAAMGGGPDLVREGFLAVALLAAVVLLPSFLRHWRRSEKISPQQLQSQLSQSNSPLVLDVRNPDEFVGERGHIPGAVLIPLPEIDKRLDELRPHRTRPIVAI